MIGRISLSECGRSSETDVPCSPWWCTVEDDFGFTMRTAKRGLHSRAIIF